MMPVMYTSRNGTSSMNFSPNIIIRATQKKMMSYPVMSNGAWDRRLSDPRFAPASRASKTATGLN